MLNGFGITTGSEFSNENLFRSGGSLCRERLEH